MKHLFVPYYIAKLLHDKGFDIKCLGYIKPDGEVRLFEIMPLDQVGLESNPNYEDGILAPLYQEVIDWFRENHSVYLNVITYTKRFSDDFNFKGRYHWSVVDEKETINIGGELTVYYEALHEVIEQAINHIK